jgi:hypothetical protein
MAAGRHFPDPAVPITLLETAVKCPKSRGSRLQWRRSGGVAQLVRAAES